MRSILALLASLAFATAATAQIAPLQPIAITDVTVIDVAEAMPEPGRTVIVTGDRITVVADTAEVEIPPGATVINARGKFLIPGLWDMHAHTSSDRITREILYPLFVAHGVTGIRNTKGDCFETGHNDCGPGESSIHQVHARREAIAAGELVGPRIVASSALADGSSGGSSVQDPANAADARAFVRLGKERGADFIKVYDWMPREAYFALTDEAKRLGLSFAGHVPVAVRASEASDAGQASIEHLGIGNILEECSSREDELRARILAEIEKDQPKFLPVWLEMVETHDPQKCAALAQRFVRNGTWITPTLMTARLPGELRQDDWRDDPYARFAPPEERRVMEEIEQDYLRNKGTAAELAPVNKWIRELTGSMHRAGVRMLAGSDVGDPGIFWGIGLHQELELLVSAGLTNADALRAATLGPAEYLGRTDALGTVEQGKAADLVLLEANPLEDIRNTQRISAVVARGRLFDREALDRLLVNAERAAQQSAESVQ